MGKKLQGGLEFGRLLYLMAVVSAVALVIGGYPTYRYAGWAGIVAACWALAVILAVMFASGAILLRVMRTKGFLAATQWSFGGAVIRIPLAVGLAVAVRWTVAVPPKPLLLWVAVFYVLLVGVECFWLSRGLKSQDTHERRLEHTGDSESPGARL